MQGGGIGRGHSAHLVEMHDALLIALGKEGQIHLHGELGQRAGSELAKRFGERELDLAHQDTVAELVQRANCRKARRGTQGEPLMPWLAGSRKGDAPSLWLTRASTASSSSW